MGQGRGGLIPYEKRKETLVLISEAVLSGCRKEKACELLGLSMRTIQRWIKSSFGDRRKGAKKRVPSKITENEKIKIIECCNSPAFRDLPPSQIVPLLADNGRYIASESSFYRVLKEKAMLAHRTNTQPADKYKPTPLIAKGPNEVWSWDITYLPSRVKGQFFYLYLILDIYSRKIVGSRVYAEESANYAAQLAQEAAFQENTDNSGLVLHSDNGSPMKGATMLATLQELGIMASFSRPSVSNDNPYSESLFRTLKYRPEYPRKAFANIQTAQAWVDDFTHWYNNEHLHSSLNFITPSARHNGYDDEILMARKKVYENAKRKRPERWSGSVKNFNKKGDVLLNPLKEKKKEVIVIRDAA